MHNSFKALGILTAILLTTVKITAQPNEKPEGLWAGDWLQNGAKLTVSTNFISSNGKLKGTFSSDQLRAIDIPLQEVNLIGQKISWKLVGDASTTLFNGTISGDKIVGVFQDGKSGGVFLFVRSKEKPEKPLEEELVIKNGDVNISGTLLHPDGTGRKFPLIIFIHGSGPEGRWASKYLAVRFAQNGIAAFIYDKRGVGSSTGDWKSAGFEDLVNDAAAVIRTLKKHDGIDSNKVGIHGHSQGGAIVPWVAVKEQNLAFIVCSSGPGIRMDEVERYSLMNNIGIDTLQPKQKKKAEEFVYAVVQTGYHNFPYSELVKYWNTIKDEPWAFKLPPQDDYYWTFSKKISGYDPVTYWKKVNAPVLFLYGQKDERVPVRKSITRIAENLLTQNADDVTIKIFTNADHTLRLVQKTTGNFQWPQNAKDYPGVLIDWVKNIVK